MRSKKVVPLILSAMVVVGGIGYGVVKNADKLPFDQGKMKVVYKDEINLGQDADIEAAAEEKKEPYADERNRDEGDTQPEAAENDAKESNSSGAASQVQSGQANQTDQANQTGQSNQTDQENQAGQSNQTDQENQLDQSESQQATNPSVMESGYYSTVLNPNSDGSTHGVTKKVEYDENSITFYGTFSKSESDDFAAYELLEDGKYTFELTPQTEYSGWEQDGKYPWSKENALRTCQRLNGLGVTLKVTDGTIDEMSFGS